MRCGLFAIFSCLAILATGCGTDTTNQGGMNSGARTTNKPVIEERTGDQPRTTDGPGITTDRLPPAGQPALPEPNLGTDIAPTTITPAGTTPTTTDQNQNTTPPINPKPAPDRQTPPATTP